ncbi:hypothetical protein VB735_18615 [Halotia wernerae UHCC 0503]|nr:hypothetical protein [Halotia wernerae UHCC 0503]
MNLSWVHIHLILNHFPIIGAIFGLLLLIVALFRKSEELKLASYWVFAIIALITIPVYFSGTQAATVVSNLPNVSDSIIHSHREIAQQSLIALEILGIISLASLFLFRGARKTPTWFSATLLILVVVATGLVSWTGLRGGVIRHTEVRGDFEVLVPTDETESNIQEGSGTNNEHSDDPGHSH